MSSNPAVTEASRKVVQTMYSSALSGDQAAFIGCLDENLVVSEPAFLPYGGKHLGVAGFVALFADVGKIMDVSTITVDSLVADGDVVVAFIRVKTVADGSVVKIAERSVVKNGKIVTMDIYFHELASLINIIKR